MPFLHRDNGRGGGGSKENRRSWGNFSNLDSPQSAGPATAPINAQHSNEGGSGSGSAGGSHDWRWTDWEAPSSPEAARSPMTSVSATCFPRSRHPTAFTSYSEGACSGDWTNNAPEEIENLTASLNTLSVASTSASSSNASNQQFVQERHLYEIVENNVEPPWPPEQSPTTSLNSLPNIGLISRGRDVLRWSGALPPRGVDSRSGYSPKVFLGGLPWDITEETLMQVLNNYQPLRVEWPGREGQAGSTASAGAEYSPRGYAYVTFESERSVRTLLAAAHSDGLNWFYRMSSRNMRSKEVQVIPWAVSDSNWVVGGSARLEPSRTVFVGALHGMLSAFALAIIMNDLFSGVIYAGIDTDKNKYPIGSGRVTFNNVHSYVRAVSAGYVEIATDKFTKTVQVDPYLEDSMCSSCNLQQGPYFCRDPACFRYFCRSCWARQHNGVNHKQLMRNSKSAYNGALATQFIAPSDMATPASAGPAQSHGRRSSKFMQDSPNIASAGSASMVDANDHGVAPPAVVSMHQQQTPRAQTLAVPGQSYHNGYRKSSAGTPSLSPTGSSDLEVAAESFPQLSM